MPLVPPSGGTPAGVDTQLQKNDSDEFGGANLYDVGGLIGVNETTPTEQLDVDGNLLANKAAIGSSAAIDSGTAFGGPSDAIVGLRIEETYTDLTTVSHYDGIGMINHLDPVNGSSYGDFAGFVSWTEIEDGNPEPIREVEGISSAIWHLGTGDIDRLRGHRTILGFWNTEGLGAVVDDVIGFEIEAREIGATDTSANNFYGVRMDSGFLSMDVNNNAYGFYVEDLDGNLGATNSYCFYSTGANDVAYIAGSLGVGTNNPSTKVHVVGGVTADKLNQLTSSAADPTTTEYPNNKDWGIHKNTSSGNVFIACNDSGTIRKTQLT